MVTAEYYKELQESMEKMSVDELISEFNQQVGSRAWTSIRGVHDRLLIEALIAKGVDVSAIYDGVTISFSKKVKLSEQKNKVIFA
jgi:metallophosphoesterase superfamily enzyme